jgi:hypothetical protein
MAQVDVAATDITVAGRFPLGNGKWLIYGKLQGPNTSETSGSELTAAVALGAWGVTEIHAMWFTAGAVAAYSTGFLAPVFQPVNDGTTCGTIHWFTYDPTAGAATGLTTELAATDLSTYYWPFLALAT